MSQSLCSSPGRLSLAGMHARSPSCLVPTHPVPLHPHHPHRIWSRAACFSSLSSLCNLRPNASLLFRARPPSLSSAASCTSHVAVRSVPMVFRLRRTRIPLRDPSDALSFWASHTVSNGHYRSVTLKKHTCDFAQKIKKPHHQHWVVGRRRNGSHLDGFTPHHHPHTSASPWPRCGAPPTSCVK